MWSPSPHQVKRILYAKAMLQRELLPHVGQEENCETLKGFFLGYTVHKMLMCSLGRADEDDRDHYGTTTTQPARHHTDIDSTASTAQPRRRSAHG